MECINIDYFSGQNFCIQQIEILCGNPASFDSHEKIQKIIMFLYQSEGLSKHVDSFIQMLSLMDFKERPPFVLTPLLLDDLHEDRFSRCFFLYLLVMNGERFKLFPCFKFMIVEIISLFSPPSLCVVGIWICSMIPAKMSLIVFWQRWKMKHVWLIL